MVAQPFKAGVLGLTRRLKPAATVCRHSVTNTRANLAKLR